VGEDQAFVDPVLAGQICVGEFPGRQHDLEILTVHGIAVVVHVLKPVVGPDLLQLAVGAQERGVIPEADVPDRRVVFIDVPSREIVIHVEGDLLDAVQIVAQAGHADIVFDVGGFHDHLIGGDLELLEEGRIDHDADKINGEQGAQGDHGQAPLPFEHPCDQDRPGGRGQEGKESVGRELGMDIRVARSEDDAVFRVEHPQGLEIEARTHVDDH